MLFHFLATSGRHPRKIHVKFRNSDKKLTVLRPYESENLKSRFNKDSISLISSLKVWGFCPPLERHFGRKILLEIHNCLKQCYIVDCLCELPSWLKENQCLLKFILECHFDFISFNTPLFPRWQAGITKCIRFSFSSIYWKRRSKAQWNKWYLIHTVL